MVLLYGIEGSNSLIPLWATLIGMGVELLLADFVIVLLGKNQKLRNCLSLRGYYFDYDFQDKWNDIMGKM